MAAFRPGWRVPALAFGALHWALHAVSHLLDIGDSDPEWLGPFGFIAITPAPRSWGAAVAGGRP